jgi:hypothetical protein
MSQRIDIPGGGAVLTEGGQSATVRTRADGARVVDIDGGGKVVFMSVAKAPPAPPAPPVRRRDPGVLTAREKRLIDKTLTTVASKLKQLSARVRELELENDRLRAAVGEP